MRNFKKGILLLVSIVSTCFSVNAQTDSDGAMRVFMYTDYIYTDNDDEWGTDEHTHKLWRQEWGDASGNGTGWDQYACWGMNCGGGCQGTVNWGLDYNFYNQSTVPTQNRIQAEYFEDDGGDRCNYDNPWYGNSDDDRNQWTQNYNVRTGCPYVWTYLGWQGSLWRNVHYSRFYYSSPRPDNAYANGSSGTVSICGPQTITLSSAGRQCTSSLYYWYKDGVYIGNTTGSLSYYATTSGTYTVYTNDQGANSIWNRSVVVNITSPPTANAGAAITQCGTAAITTDGASHSGTSVLWSWSGTAATLAGATSINGWTLAPTSATTAGSGTLTLTVSTPGCPNAVSTRSVAWHILPTGSAGSNISQCFDSTPLAALPMTGATMNGYGQSVTGTWSTVSGSGTGTWAQNTGNPALATFTPTSQSGSLTVRLRVQATSGYCNGQFNDYTRTITWSRIGGSAGPAVSQCSTTNITTAGATIYGAGTTVNWTWLPGTGSATLNNPTSLTGCFLSGLSASGTGTLRLTITGVSPCGNLVLNKSVAWSSTPLGNAGPNIAVCSGSGTPIPMTGATGGGLTGNPTWTGGTGLGTWTNGGSDPAAWTFTPNVSNPSGSFTATLNVAGIAPCTGSAPPTTRTVSWTTPPTISIGGAINSCNGSAPVTLTGATAGGSISGFTWTVQSGGGSITGSGTNPATYQYDTPGTNGTAVVRLTANANGNCTVSPYLEQTIQWGSIAASSPATITSCGNVANITMAGTATGQVDYITWTGQSGGNWATTHGTNPAAWVFDPTAASGNFNATLTVYGDGACVGQTTTSVTNVDWDVYPTVEAGTPITACTGTGVNIPMGTSPNAAGQYGTVQWTTLSTTYGAGTWNNGGTNPDNWTFTPSTDEGFIVAQLQVNGSANCTGTNVTDTRTIQWSKAPVISSIVTTANSNCNFANGAIVITATGNGPLSYSSDNGGFYQPLSTIPGLATGNYSVVVQDTTGCSTPYASNPVNVGGLTPVTASSVTVTSNSLCAGDISGSITVANVTGGGGGPFAFTLSDPIENRWVDISGFPLLIDSLAAGTYPVTIQDQFGCFSTTYIRTITSPPPIVINSLSVVDVVGCGSGGTGSITASASGGTGTLNYYLNGGVNTPATSGAWTGRPGGSYEVMVQDANGCLTIAQTQINAPWTVTAGNDAYNCGTVSTTLRGSIVGQLPTDCTPVCTSSCGIPSHCAAAGTNLSDDWISFVGFNTISNSTGSTAYSNFTGISTTVNRGASYTLSVTVSKNSGWNQCVRAYIDWNRNGLFTDSGELYELGCSTANPQNTSLSITVPAGATLGNTRMRIYETYAGVPAADGCGTLTYSEVEDYTLNVVGANTVCSPSYTWSPAGGSSLTGTVSPSATTTYTLTVNDGSGCIQSESVTVNVSNETTTASIADIACFGNTNGCVTLNPVNGVQPYLLFGPSNAVQVYGGSMRPIQVNNTSGIAYSNHPVKITVPYSAGMRADFGDIRFVHSNQSKINYWIESYTLSTQAVVWVKMPTLPTGISTIYMTFGNVSLTSESEGDNVFEFFDDFNSFNSSKWTQGIISGTGGTNWSYYGGSLIGGNTNRIQTSIPSFTGSRISEGRVFESSAAVNGFTTLGFYQTSANGFNILSHNGTNFVRSDAVWYNFGVTAPNQINGWTRDYIMARGATSIARRTRESSGSTIAYTVNNSGLATERVRLGARGDNGAYDQNFSAQWDWLFVRQYISVEPAITFLAVQTSNNQFCGFAAGTYNFNAVDVAGCNNSVSATINQPGSALSLSLSMSPIGCYVTNDGAIDITASGGTPVSPPPAYYYNWAGPSGFSSTSEDVSGLFTGIYNVTVADDNACTANGTVTVTQLVPINAGYFTWKGSTNVLWQVDSNWDCRLPTATSRVIIPGTPVGGNLPEIENLIIGDVWDITIQGSTVDLLKIHPGGKLRIFKP